MAKQYPDSLKAALTRMWREGWSKKALSRLSGIHPVTLSYWVDPEFRTRRLINNQKAEEPEQKKARDRDYYTRNASKRKAYQRQYRRLHRGLVNEQNARRRKAVRRATPAWLTKRHKQEIKLLYVEAADKGLEVDHIDPLLGRTVCGLHVPWNLQLLTAEENRRKSNLLATQALGS